MIDFISGLIGLGIAQGLFLGLGLFVKSLSTNRRANRLLGTLLLAFSVSISFALLLRTGWYVRLPHLLNVSSPTIFLFGPLFYLYVRTLTTAPSDSLRRAMIHFIPFILNILWLIPFYMLDGIDKVKVVEHAMQGDVGVDSVVIGILQLVHLFCYLVMGWVTLNRYRASLKEQFSAIHRINFSWLRNLIIMFWIAYGAMLTAFACLLFGWNIFVPMQMAVAVIAAGAIYALGFLGLRQPEVFHGVLQLPTAKKYEASTLTPVRTEEYLRLLQSIMDTARPYLQPELTLQALADQCKIPAYHLSQLLNERLNQNFFDFINRQRVEEAKRLLLDPSRNHYSLFAIGQESGFNSKSVFNTAFKRYTGQTPSEFRTSRLINTKSKRAAAEE